MNRRGGYFYKITKTGSECSDINISGKFDIRLSNVDLGLLEEYRISPRVNRLSASKGSGDNYVRKSLHHLIIPFEEGKVIDHINGNVYDNSRENLRICSHAENMQNSKRRKHNGSRYKGVRRMPSGKYVTIFNKTTKGTYSTEELAAKIYDIHSIKAFGEFARPNFKLTEEDQKDLWHIFDERQKDLRNKSIYFRSDTRKWQVKVKTGVRKYKYLGCYPDYGKALRVLNEFKPEVEND